MTASWGALWRAIGRLGPQRLPHLRAYRGEACSVPVEWRTPQAAWPGEIGGTLRAGGPHVGIFVVGAMGVECGTDFGHLATPEAKLTERHAHALKRAVMLKSCAGGQTPALMVRDRVSESSEEGLEIRARLCLGGAETQS